MLVSPLAAQTVLKMGFDFLPLQQFTKPSGAAGDDSFEVGPLSFAMRVTHRGRLALDNC